MFEKYRHLWLGLLTVAGAVYLFADSQPLVASSNERAIKRVKVGTVETASSHRQLRFSGVTRAAQRARLSFALGGRIVQRPVEIGQQVTKGQALAVLNDSELRNAVDTARGAVDELKARSNQLQRDLARAEKLSLAKAVTAEELEQTRAGLEAIEASQQAAAARLRETKRLFSEATLRAPFAGTITDVLFEPGEVVAPGQPVVRLDGQGDLEVEVEVPESVVPRIQAGDSAMVSIPLLGRSDLAAVIKSVGRTVAGPGRLFPVVATLPAAASLMAGTTAELTLELQSAQVLSLPIEAVVDPGGRRPAVFKILPGQPTQVRKVFITLGDLIGARVEATGELALGDQVVVGGQRGLLDGETVEIEETVELEP